MFGAYSWRSRLFVFAYLVALGLTFAGCGTAPGVPAAAASPTAFLPLTPSPALATSASASALTLSPSSVSASTSRTAAKATPGTPEPDVALKGKATASTGQESAQLAIDGKMDTIWNSASYPVQWILITLDKPYLVDKIDLLITLAPAGKTSHEVWLGTPSGDLSLYQKFDDVDTKDGQDFSVDVQPAQIVDRVLVRTTTGPSFVAWKEIQVFGQPPEDAQVKPVLPGSDAWIDWPNLALSGGFDLPDQITNAGDGSGRLFVVEQHGTIRVMANLLGKPSLFLDLTDRVKCCEEQGLLSIAFPPGYAQKHYFYLSYTNHTNDLIISRFHLTADPNVADPKSEQVILDIPEPTTVHHSGHLAFGPKDGYLYVGSGDGGVPADNANNAQNPDSLLGKILRIDVESGATPYAIPPTNPFVNQPGHRPEIWALGLRNPWGFSFDPRNGDLYIGDVGEDTYEEIDYQPGNSPGGQNYGWHIMEGLHCFGGAATCNQNGLTLPVAEYSHKEGCAVMGGPVYRGATFPRMQGVYFYADLCSGKIWALLQKNGGWKNTLLLTAPFQVSSIGQDEAGNLYVTDYNHGGAMALVDVPPATPTPTHN